MKCDLEVLRVSLLAESQTVNLASSAFNVFVISARSLPSRKTLVSSENQIANNFSETFGRSFIPSKKKRGPKIDPCGTPQVIVFCVELLLFIVTNCCLFGR